jgi:hypothetical protein
MPVAMKPLDSVAGVMFLVAAVPTLFFGLFSILGTLMGAGMTVVGVVEEPEMALMGVALGLVYGIWMVVCLLAGVLQLSAGIRIFMGHKDKLTWAATLCSLLPMMTVYCAPFGVMAFVFGLVALLTDLKESQEG